MNNQIRTAPPGVAYRVVGSTATCDRARSRPAVAAVEEAGGQTVARTGGCGDGDGGRRRFQRRGWGQGWRRGATGGGGGGDGGESGGGGGSEGGKGGALGGEGGGGDSGSGGGTVGDGGGGGDFCKLQ